MKKNSPAFTLTETAAAIAIIAFFVIPIIALWSEGFDSLEKSDELTSSVTISEKILADLQTGLQHGRILIKKSAFNNDDTNYLDKSYINLPTSQFASANPTDFYLQYSKDGKPYEQLDERDYKDGTSPVSIPVTDELGRKSYANISLIVKVSLSMAEYTPLTRQELLDIQSQEHNVMGTGTDNSINALSVTISIESPCGTEEENRKKINYQSILTTGNIGNV